MNAEAAAKPFASSCSAICLKHYGPTLKVFQPECIVADISWCIPNMSYALCWHCLRLLVNNGVQGGGEEVGAV